MDADHLDIYGTAAEVQQAFIEFSGKLKPGGLLLNKRGLERSAELKATTTWNTAWKISGNCPAQLSEGRHSAAGALLPASG